MKAAAYHFQSSFKQKEWLSMLMSILCFAVSMNCLHKLENPKKEHPIPITKSTARIFSLCTSIWAVISEPVRHLHLHLHPCQTTEIQLSHLQSKCSMHVNGKTEVITAKWHYIIVPNYNPDLPHRRENCHTCQNWKESSSLKHPCIGFLFFVVPLIDLV